ncbi:bifunctional 3-deoxy-7-phosphoheptulonate synthase/chorismate mutase [Proteiniborus sp. MB09-C3]|uniref:bifunctional 3-deoxy-7-phosphoheptulonate synthase/chorismate mutase n=1 Tax=Proteiniborus sp. MB09-C3 TaxID=3050072 RepID=UPI002555FC48|nr:bifunctional 3-deoxy-7-phosphoheptulonate synthase/chorismate mutase [Proteiniborus sp. MB09-C3]WIV10788.1 bifunctional 3-deoxy-7-phosphoheptulonate synthase/chorismate mutase [Proteiniborus sp. MB09-C3]
MDMFIIKNDGNSRKIIDLGDGIRIGEREFTIISGPCAVENEEQIELAAEALSSMGIKILRGGAFKPRTSPYTFQGLGLEGLRLLKNAGKRHNMKVISEVMDPRDLEASYDYVDIFQIGSRNMQNYTLLKEVGKFNKPVLLKRGMAATIEEWVMAAEYIASEGNDKIILCERGIRTFEEYTRNTLDLTVVPIIKELTNLPIIVDPSHGTGRKELIRPLTRASVAIGADGVMIEAHPNPCEALSDGKQSLNFEEMRAVLSDIEAIKNCMDNLNS